LSSIKLKNIGELASYNSKNDSVLINQNIDVFIEDEIITDIGYNLGVADKTLNCEGKLVTPGFVDAHTHPVFVNGRAKDFELRCQGFSYKEINDLGRGINLNVNDIRKISEYDLKKIVSNRMNVFLNNGTTTVEAKSGYGLDVDSELKSLIVLDEVNKNHNIDIVSTLMAAHSIPSEFKSKPGKYVDLICNHIIPLTAKNNLAKFNDVFCEEGYFNINQTRRILQKGLDFGLLPRLHADEFNSFGASILAGELGAVSADHLMHITVQGIKALKENSVIAVLLPGTTFSLGNKQYAPYGELKSYGVPVALASDFNPGSCFINSMPFIIALACIYMGFSPEEALMSTTYIPAKSLKLENEIGSIENGKNADILIWDIHKLNELPFSWNQPNLQSVIKRGKVVF
tara:strand:- start:614 stop:1816 length:1203 start_codon:yes stop_codon:yes gene_type:complete